MFDLQYHYCKRHLSAYVDGDISPTVRRRMARYIDTNPRCAELYRQYRAVSCEIAATLPAFGRPDTAGLDRIWSGIQAEINPRPVPLRQHVQYRLRYAVGVLVVFALVWIPLLVADTPVGAISPATQPDPMIQVAAATEQPDGVQALTGTQPAIFTENVGAAGPVAAEVPPGTPTPAGLSGR